MTAQRSKILVVDDTEPNLRLLRALLTGAGYEVITAACGTDGIAAATRENPDLILLDIMMPGLDGFETCRRLKEMKNTRDIPVIIMTALAETEHKVRGFDAGAVDYVTKPIQRQEVVARVGVHLRIRELTTGLRKANESLDRLNEELEQRVSERTKELERRNHELEQMNKAFVGRELRMEELKKRIRELEERLA